jgi:hypothetical protein
VSNFRQLVSEHQNDLPFLWNNENPIVGETYLTMAEIWNEEKPKRGYKKDEIIRGYKQDRQIGCPTLMTIT